VGGVINTGGKSLKEEKQGLGQSKSQITAFVEENSLGHRKKLRVVQVRMANANNN